MVVLAATLMGDAFYKPATGMKTFFCQRYNQGVEIGAARCSALRARRTHVRV